MAQKPDFSYAHLNLGIVHADLRQYDLADVHFAQAVHPHPNDLTARRRWARSLAEQHRLREAILQYVAAVEIDPDDHSLRHALAKLYLEAGERDAARQQWRVAALLAPLEPDYAERLRALETAAK